jgi:hypothetical protein
MPAHKKSTCLGFSIRSCSAVIPANSVLQNQKIISFYLPYRKIFQSDMTASHTDHLMTHHSHSMMTHEYPDAVSRAMCVEQWAHGGTFLNNGGL